MKKIVTCKACDLVVNLDEDGNSIEVCPRCGNRLSEGKYCKESDIAVIAVAAILFLGISIVEPFMSIDKMGFGTSMSLYSIVSILKAQWGSLLYAFLFFTFFSPLSVLLLIFYSGINKEWKPGHKIGKYYAFCHSMCMVDVFILGVAVSLVKLTAMVTVQFHVGFYSSIAFTILLMWCCSKFKPSRMWEKVKEQESYELEAGKTAKSQGFKKCNECGYVFKSSSEYEKCPRCGHKVSYRDSECLQKSFALLVAAIILFLPSNLYPVMYTNLLGTPIGSNIISGVIAMWNMGSWFVAGVILIFSVFIPAFKIFSLSYILLVTKMDSIRSKKKVSRLFRFVVFVGRWSLIDVYVVIIMASIVRINSLIVIDPGFAIICFCSVVIITVFSADGFDERLIWDASE